MVLELTGPKDSDGFRTAQAKIYPAALNEILAQGILKFAAKLRGPNKVVADECPEDLNRMRTFDYIDQTVVQPDFQDLF